MTRHEFIFSNQPLHRISRHLVFWGFYFFYFWMQSINPSGVEDFSQSETYKFALYSLFCFVPLCILSTYISLYYLLPAFLEKKKYLLFFGSIFILLIGGMFINYFLAEIFVNNSDYKKLTESPFFAIVGLSQINIKWAITIALIAMGIKLTKTQYLQQQENMEIARKKTLTELQIQKARINPALLFDSLDNIYAKIKSGSDEAGVMVLKLSDLLSYSLYESDAEMVQLDQELSGIRDFIFLENASPKSLVSIDMRVIGDTADKYTVPILLPLIQDCIDLIHQDKKAVELMTLHINAEGDSLLVKLFFSSAACRESCGINLDTILNKLQNRLSLMKVRDNYYFDNRVSEQHEGFVLDLPLTYNVKPKRNSSSKEQSFVYDRA